jgi:hypothetical protein
MLNSLLFKCKSVIFGFSRQAFLDLPSGAACPPHYSETSPPHSYLLDSLRPTVHPIKVTHLGTEATSLSSMLSEKTIVEMALEGVTCSNSWRSRLYVISNSVYLIISTLRMSRR